MSTTAGRCRAIRTYRLVKEMKSKELMPNGNVMWPCRHDDPGDKSRIHVRKQPRHCYACFWVSSLAEPFKFPFPLSLALLFLITSGMEKILGQSSSYSSCRPSKQCRSQIPHTICMYAPVPVMRCLVILSEQGPYVQDVKVLTIERLTTNHVPLTIFPMANRFLFSISATSSTGCYLVPRCQNQEGK